MRKYLSTLHKKSPRHQKHFALAVSGGFTLLIFAVWMFVNFGEGAVVASNGETQVSKNEVSPLESIGASLASSFEALGDAWGDLTGGFGGVDFNADYEELKTNTLETYGQ